MHGLKLNFPQTSFKKRRFFLSFLALSIIILIYQICLKLVKECVITLRNNYYTTKYLTNYKGISFIFNFIFEANQELLSPFSVIKLLSVHSSFFWDFPGQKSFCVTSSIAHFWQCVTMMWCLKVESLRVCNFCCMGTL